MERDANSLLGWYFGRLCQSSVYGRDYIFKDVKAGIFLSFFFAKTNNFIFKRWRTCKLTLQYQGFK